MSQDNLRDALLKLDAMDLAGTPDTRREVMKIIERDRRRVRLLAAITIFLWVIVTAAIVFVLYIYSLYLPKEMQMLQDLGARPRIMNVAEDLPEASIILISVVSKGTAVVAGSVGLLALATLSTVFLVLSTRRATLRQVSSSLLEISEQVKALRQAMAKPPAGGA